MIKHNALLLLLLVSAFCSFAQQDPQFSMYMFNPLAVNPAYAGSREVLSSVLVHRSQWVGLEGAPETQALAINAPLKNKKMGLGLQVVNDRIGPRTTQNITGIYAYRLKLGAGKLAFGLKGGIINYRIDRSKITYREEETSASTETTKEFIKPTADFGMYYNSKTFYIGLAAEHLNEWNADAESTALNGGTIGGVLSNNVNFTGTIGKAFVINRELTLKTSALIRMANETANIDINSGILIKNKILFGLSYRSSKALVVMTEINISKNLRMGVGYDIDRNDVALSTGGSLEIFIGYDIGLFKSKVISPRYF